MDEPIAKKAYYSIGEACDLTDLKPHVLRYWETQFPTLKPKKNRAGNRVYRREDIDSILHLKNLLYGQKYTIEGARKKLKEMRAGEKIKKERVAVRRPEVVASMKADLNQLAERLTLP